MEGRRPKRRCVTTKSLVPSAVHYVGYVEDDETPEMIMHKFLELERIQTEAAAKRKGSQPPEDATVAPSGPEPSHADRGANVWLGDEQGPSNVTDTLAPTLGGHRSSSLPFTHHAGASTVHPPAREASTSQQHADTLQHLQGSADGAFDEDMLLEVFKQTSTFNVRSAMQNNDLFFNGAAAGSSSTRPAALGAFGEELPGCMSDSEMDAENMHYLRGFWSEEDFDQARVAASKAKRGGVKRPPRPPKEAREGLKRMPGEANARHVRAQLVTQYNRDTNALIRRRTRVEALPGALVQVRIPTPLPLSWGRSVLPYQPYTPPTTRPPGTPGGQGADTNVLISAPDLTNYPYSTLGKIYQAVLVNTGWEMPPADPSPGRSHAQVQAAMTQRLAKVPMPALCPYGFICVWADKAMLHAVVRLLEAWSFSYVENLTWAFLAPNNSIVRWPSRYLSNSHRTLLIFRKHGWKDGEGRDIELRHQRNPDAILDSVLAAQGRPWAVPREVYNTLEMMLPNSRGHMLELWAATDSTRQGWDQLAEVPQRVQVQQQLQQQQQQQ